MYLADALRHTRLNIALSILGHTKLLFECVPNNNGLYNLLRDLWETKLAIILAALHKRATFT